MKNETTETSSMVTDETAYEQLSQATNVMGSRVHALYFVETTLLILVKHEMMET